MNEEMKDWRLKLRYGQLSTPFQHFTVLADGCVGVLAEGFECRPGRAWMAMKAWARNSDESSEMICVIGHQIGFTVDGRIEIYETEPEEPPRDKPYGYAIGFTPYDEDV